MNSVRIVIHPYKSVEGRPEPPITWDLLYENESGETVNAGNFATPDEASAEVYRLQAEAARAAEGG